MAKTVKERLTDAKTAIKGAASKAYSAIEAKALAKTVKMKNAEYKGFYEKIENIGTNCSNLNTQTKKIQTILKKIQKGLNKLSKIPNQAKDEDEQFKLEKKSGELKNGLSYLHHNDLKTAIGELDSCINSINTSYTEAKDYYQEKLETRLF